MHFGSLRSFQSRVFGSNSPSSPGPASSSSSLTAPTSSRSSGGNPPMPQTPTSAAPQPTKKVQKAPVKVDYVTNGMIRELRELIRYRYALDCKIWDIGRKVKWHSRDTVLIDMQRSDAALVTIRTTLDGWNRQEYFATEEEFNRFKEIRNRIMSASTRNWGTDPPWKK